MWFPPAERDKNCLEQVMKFAARLSLNNFNHETTYQQLLDSLKWKPVARIVIEKRLVTIKRYMDGKRYMPQCAFPLELPPTTRCSQLVRNLNTRKSCILATFKSQSNCLEDKLCAAMMRALWNALSEETVGLRHEAFRSTILSYDFFLYLCNLGF